MVTSRTPLRAVLLGLLLCLPAARAAEPFSLAALLERFAERGELQMDYRQTRSLPMLTAELTSRGTLTYRPPDYLRKQQTEPEQVLVVIEGDQARMIGPDGRERSASLADHPELEALVEALRGMLAGDPKALDAFYRSELTGDWGGWELQLTPRRKGMALQVPSIRLSGAQGQLQAVHTRQSSGEETTLHLLTDAG